MKHHHLSCLKRRNGDTASLCLNGCNPRRSWGQHTFCCHLSSLYLTSECAFGGRYCVTWGICVLFSSAANCQDYITSVVGEWMSMKHCWNDTGWGRLKNSDRNCPSACYLFWSWIRASTVRDQQLTACVMGWWSNVPSTNCEWFSSSFAVCVGTNVLKDRGLSLGSSHPGLFACFSLKMKVLWTFKMSGTAHPVSVSHCRTLLPSLCVWRQGGTYFY